MNATSMDRRIDSLKPGKRITLSESNGIRVVAERSSNGKALRFVRITTDGFVVFKTMAF